MSHLFATRFTIRHCFQNELVAGPESDRTEKIPYGHLNQKLCQVSTRSDQREIVCV